MKETKSFGSSMGSAPIPRLIVRQSLPTVAAMIATSVYNMADSFFAARLGAEAAAGVGIVFSLMAMIQAVGFTVALGGSTWISRLLGEKKEQEARQVAVATVWMGLLAGGILAAVCLAFATPLARLLGAEDKVLRYAVAYVRPIALTAPFTAGCFGFSCILRAHGRALFSMVGIVAGGLLNMVLDPLLMFTFSLGLAGAGWATLMGQGVSFFVLLAPFLAKNNPLICGKRQLPKKTGTHLTIIKNGMSSFFRQGLISITSVLLNRTAAAYGAGAVAGLAAAGKVAGLLYSAFLGVGQGYQPVAGYCYGAKKKGRMKQAFAFTLTFGTGALTVAAWLCLGKTPALMAWFAAGDIAITDVAVRALQWQLMAMPLIPLGVLTNMTVQASDRPVVATLLACLRQGICFLPFILLLPRFWGLTGLQLAQPLADGLTFLVSLPVIRHFFRQQKKQAL